MTVRRFWVRLFPDADPRYFDSSRFFLISQYGEPHRRYHTMDHIKSCLRELGGFGYGAANPDVVDVAILCHDIFYDTRATNNEKRSSVWCRNVCRLLGRPELCLPAAEAILATKHNGRADTEEARLVVDVDLSILGASEEAFDLYERQIREEYEWVPEEAFRSGRRRILEGFLREPTIYHGGWFQDRYEAAARANLSRSIADRSPASGSPA